MNQALRALVGYERAAASSRREWHKVEAAAYDRELFTYNLQHLSEDWSALAWNPLCSGRALLDELVASAARQGLRLASRPFGALVALSSRVRELQRGFVKSNPVRRTNSSEGTTGRRDLPPIPVTVPHEVTDRDPA